jgi:hypothetical protein
MYEATARARAAIHTHATRDKGAKTGSPPARKCKEGGVQLQTATPRLPLELGACSLEPERPENECDPPSPYGLRLV